MRCTKASGLVGAEAQLCGHLASQWVPPKLLIALCTQIVTSLLVHIVTDGVCRFVVESFQDFPVSYTHLTLPTIYSV